jgi:hypothetical protein
MSVAADERLPGLMITTVFWGERMLDIFCRSALRNVAALVDEIPAGLRGRSTYVIVTKREEAEALRDHRLIGRLRSILSVEIRDTLDELGRDQWGYYGPMVIAQEELVAEATVRGLGIVFWGPDLLVSDGSLRHVIEKADEGYRIVIGPSARAIAESMLPALDALGRDDSSGILRLDDSTLAKMLFQHWHNINEIYVWNRPLRTTEGAFLYFKVSHQAMLMKYLQGPTFFAWPRAGPVRFSGFIDHHLARFCARSDGEVHIVADSRDLLTVDLTMAAREYVEIPSARSRHLDLLKQLIRHRFVGDLNLLYGRRSTRIHAMDLSEADWKRCERVFDGDVNPGLAMARFVRLLPQPLSRLVLSEQRGTQMWLDTLLRWCVRLLRPFF